MALKETVTKARRFPFAGTFTLIRHRDDGTDSTDPKDIYTSGRNVKESITGSSNLTTEDLNDGNSYDPAATYVTGSETSVAIVLNSDDPDLDIFLEGGQKLVADESHDQWYPDQRYEIGADGTVSVVDTEGSAVTISTKSPLTVRDVMTNEDYTAVESEEAPAAGQYKVDPDTGVFTFATADAGKAVYLTFGVKATGATVYVRPKVPKNSTYTLIVTGPSEDYAQTNRMRQTDTYDSVQRTGELAFMPRQKGPGQRTVNFRVVAPRACNRLKTVISPEVLPGADC